MWIVALALKRPYTLIVTSLLLAFSAFFSFFFIPKDIFPNINIPVITVIWSYSGLPAQEFSERITAYSEYTLSNNVSDINKIESQTLDGIGVIHLHLSPKANISTALSEVTAASQSILGLMPPGMLAPVILRNSSSGVPIGQLILSGKEATESDLYDFGNWRLRQYMASIRGATLLAPFGGKVRQIMVDVNSLAMQGRDLSARDINSALLKQVVTTPTGDASIGDLDYRINVNNIPVDSDSLNAIPVAHKDNKLVFLRDVAFAHEGFAPQTNVVRKDGLRSVMIKIYKNGSTSALAIIDQLKELLPTLRAAAPSGIDIDLAFDQGVVIQKTIEGIIIKGVIALLLAGMVILIFLKSWRTTLITLTSITLAMLTSIPLLTLLGETLNTMTLAGLALALGLLVNDAIVTIENIDRHMSMKKPLEQAILDASDEVTMPTLISSLSICVLLLPIFLMEGPLKLLFTPFALAAAFAIIAFYFLSHTLVPVMVKFIPPTSDSLYQEDGTFSNSFDRLRSFYASILQWALEKRGVVLALFGILFITTLLIFPFVGNDFFPSGDGGVLRLHVRVPSGTRIEVTEAIFSQVEEAIRQIIPPNEIEMLIDNIGVNPAPYTLAFGDNRMIGSYDGEILLSLKPIGKNTTEKYKATLGKELAKRFPALLFYFQPGDIPNQTLNMGMPFPIDVKVVGYNKENNLKIARELVEEISHTPGVVETHLHQVEDSPELFLEMDRMELAYAGLTQADAANDILLNFSTSTTVTPNFWLDRKTGVPYPIAVQNPKYRINTIEELLHIPISSHLTQRSQLLCDLCKLKRRSTPGVVSHYNIQPVYDIYANVQGRDLGKIASDIQKIIDKHQVSMAPGNKIIFSGVASEIREASSKLQIGFTLAIFLIYCLLVMNFQSFLAPLVIITATPGAIVGIIWTLFLTETPFTIPSLVGAIMTVGIVIANSILMLTFANLQLKLGKGTAQAAYDAALLRVRPTLMTALAIILGMIPVALALGEGGELMAPLGQAVIGGLIGATLTTLFFVPVIFSFLRPRGNPSLEGKLPRHNQPKDLNPHDEGPKS